MGSILVVAAAVILGLLVVWVMLFGKPPKKSLPLIQKRLMTEREREAIIALEALFPECRIHSQVAMAAILTTKKGLQKTERSGLRNRFDRKIIDFVIEQRVNGEILAIVELDDKTHNAAKDAERDKLTAAAGYRTVRVPPRTRLDNATLAPLFAEQAKDVSN